MNATEAQKSLKAFFAGMFGEGNVIKEWPSNRNAEDWLRRSGDAIIYAPRPDIVIGPFNIAEGANTSDIENAFTQNRPFFNRLGLSTGGESINGNPRCLIAVEIENSNKGKHMLGNIVNASLLGKVGIIITLRDEFYDEAKRINQYLKRAFEKKKVGHNPSNVVIKRYGELRRILVRYE